MPPTEFSVVVSGTLAEARARARRAAALAALLRVCSAAALFAATVLAGAALAACAAGAVEPAAALRVLLWAGVALVVFGVPAGAYVALSGQGDA